MHLGTDRMEQDVDHPTLTGCEFPGCGFLADGATEREQLDNVELHELYEHDMIDAFDIL